MHVHLQMHRIYATSQVGTEHFIAGFHFRNCIFFFHSYFFIKLYNVFDSWSFFVTLKIQKAFLYINLNPNSKRVLWKF